MRSALLLLPPVVLQGRPGRQEDSWSRLLAKLEATYCVRARLASWVLQYCLPVCH